MRSIRTVAAALAATGLLALTACGSGDGGGAQPAGAASPQPTADVTGAVREDAKLAALLPDEVRERGTLRLGSSLGTPPSAFRPDTSSKKAAGLDIEIADAVSRLLGVKLQRQEASFEAILPALTSGKYDVGTGNFGVTEDRLRTIDFVTYINDGQGFAVREDDKGLKKVTDLTQLCGKTVGVGAGTTFETTLEDNRKLCAKADKDDYEVKVYSDNAASLTSLQQGRIDVIMSTINGLRHQAAQPAAGVRFLNEYHRLDVGFALKKGSPLAKPFQAAVNRLIEDGTYGRILKKWGTEGSALKTSRISPPEIKPEQGR